MTWASVAHAAGESLTSLAATTGSIDTSGADTLFYQASWYFNSSPSIPVDSKGNTLIGLTQRVGPAGNLYSRLFYAKNATVGSSHTASFTPGGVNYPGIILAAFSGGHLTAPYNSDEVFAAPATVASGQPGSLTPPENDCLVLTTWVTQTAADIPTINSGFTVLEAFGRGGSMGDALASLIQTSAAAVNPTWSWVDSADSGTGFPMTQQSFKAAAGGGGITGPLIRFKHLGGGGALLRGRLVG